MDFMSLQKSRWWVFVVNVATLTKECCGKHCLYHDNVSQDKCPLTILLIYCTTFIQGFHGLLLDSF